MKMDRISEERGEFMEWVKRHPLYALVYAVILFIISILSSKLLEKYVEFTGYVGIVFFVFLLFIHLISGYVSHKKREKEIRNKLGKIKDNQIEGGGMTEKYKGLVVFASILREERDEIEQRIIELKNMVRENPDDGGKIDNLLEELYSKKGIGQSLRAIMHHKDKLSVCWILYTDGSKNTKDLIKKFIEGIFSPSVQIEAIEVDHPYNITHLGQKLKEINFEDKKLSESDVVFDITGGPAPVSCAMTLHCNGIVEIRLEYIHQITNKLIEVKW